MRKRMIGAGAALAAILSGCGGGGGEAPVADNVLTGPESTQNQLEGLPEGQRNAVFIRAIRDAGQDCQQVESSTLTGRHQGFPVWTARCSGGGEWTIVITSEGNAVILNPAEARLVDGNETVPQNAQGR